MKKSVFCFPLLALCLCCTRGEEVSIVPTPMKVCWKSGQCRDLQNQTISKDESLRDALGSEGYKLKVSRVGVEIAAASDTGIFYAQKTLSQLQGRCCSIVDKPRFAYRGAHLDVSRHFFSKEEIFKILDEMALYKMNNFHFHPVDNGGWRLQLDCFPSLAENGAYRPIENMDQAGRSGFPFCSKDDPNAYGGYYTKDDIREIVAYAAERYINVIPEIEFPSHSNAVFYSFPELTCTGKPNKTGEFCPANEDVYPFAEAVLSEIMELFPSKIIHIGGDEARMPDWAQCPRCQALMKEKGYTDLHQLQGYMIERIRKFIESKGRVMAGWDQILEGGLSSESIVYAYRGFIGGVKAANRGIRAVMTPGECYYLDWFQAHSDFEPKAQYGYTPLRKIYLFDPVPTTEQASLYDYSFCGPEVPDSAEYILPGNEKYIIGVQTSTWTEYIATDEHLEYMMFPRLVAIAQIGWASEKLPWEDFKKLIYGQLEALRSRGIRPYDQHDMPAIETDGQRIFLDHENPYAPIRYTLSGGDTLIYSSPIEFPDSVVTVRASVDGGLTRELTLKKGVPYVEKYLDIDPNLSW